MRVSSPRRIAVVAIAALLAAGAGAALAATLGGGSGGTTSAAAGSHQPRSSTRTAASLPAATSAAPTTTAPTSVATSAAKPPTPPPVRRPPIVWKPIPFPQTRLAETAQYALRHYGVATWRIHGPHVIVEHYTASTTMISAWSTFAQDVPDSELHELPGTCAHFIVDRDGTIYQLVPLDVICRHTVGLNLVSIGIEHVGTSDAEVLSDPAQIRASLRLTAWLMHRYRIPLGDVIGHAESLTSPWHHERYAAWRCQTHADWQPADMGVYRSRLRVVLRHHGIPVGRPVARVSSGC